MSRIDEELTELTSGLVEMTGLAAQAIERATRSLLEADLSLAEHVIADDEQLDTWQQSVDEQIVRHITRHGAVAADLRRLVASLRITADLERMGDLARHVAQVVRLKYPEQVLPTDVRRHFTDMGAVAERIALATGDVLLRPDLELVRRIDRIDDEMDRLHRELFTVMLGPNWQHPAAVAIDITLMGRYFERFADHAVAVAYHVGYQLTGQDPEELGGRA